MTMMVELKIVLLYSWFNVFEYSIFGFEIGKLIYPTITYRGYARYVLFCYYICPFYSVKIEPRVCSLSLSWTVVEYHSPSYWATYCDVIVNIEMINTMIIMMMNDLIQNY